MAENILRCEPPLPSKYLSKKSVIIAICIFGFLLSIAIILGKKKHEIKQIESSSLKAYPTNSITMLPSNYDELPPPKPAPTPFTITHNVNPDAELLKRLAKLKEEKLKRADDARKADISFQGLNSIPESGKAQKINDTQVVEGNTRGDSQLNPRDSDNRQDEKLNFLENKRDDDTLLLEPLKTPLSKYQIMAGTMIPGLMVSGINSDLPGEIIGQVSQNIFDTVSGKYLLIPQGTKILGEYDSRIVYGQERVLVIWTRLIFPNGKSISLEGMPGADLSGYAGVTDQVNNHYLRLLTGVVLSSFLSAGAQVASGRDYNSFNPSFDELAVQGVARNLNTVGQEITRKNLNIQPTLEIRPGFRFNVFVNKDMVLEGYENL